MRSGSTATLPISVRPAGFDFDPRMNAGYNSNLIRPFQGYASITEYTSGASSNYHSLQRRSSADSPITSRCKAHTRSARPSEKWPPRATQLPRIPCTGAGTAASLTSTPPMSSRQLHLYLAGLPRAPRPPRPDVRQLAGKRIPLAAERTRTLTRPLHLHARPGNAAQRYRRIG